MVGKRGHLRVVESSEMRPVEWKGRKANKSYRVREHLTEAEMSTSQFLEGKRFPKPATILSCLASSVSVQNACFATGEATGFLGRPTGHNW